MKTSTNALLLFGQVLPGATPLTCSETFHATYNLGSGIRTALSGTCYRGGRTTVDGVQNNDLQKNLRIGITIALPVIRNNSIRIFSSIGSHTRIGNDYDRVLIQVKNPE